MDLSTETLQSASLQRYRVARDMWCSVIVLNIVELMVVLSQGAIHHQYAGYVNVEKGRRKRKFNT